MSAPRECQLLGVSAPRETMSALRDGVSAMGDGGVCHQGWGVCSQGWGVCYWGQGCLLPRMGVSALEEGSVPRGVVCSQGMCIPACNVTGVKT